METERIRVLLIEDSLPDAEVVREMLGVVRKPFEIEVVNRLASAMPVLNESTFDIVLVDLNLPDSFGLDSFVAIQNNSPHLPIIVLTGLDDEQLGQQALKQGAQDYLVKNQIDPRLLDHSIRYAIERK